MSAAATAAGYLYASGRLRGKGKDGEVESREEAGAKRARVRVAALPPKVDVVPEQPAVERPRRTPRIEYRVRRWRPDAE